MMIHDTRSGEEVVINTISVTPKQLEGSLLPIRGATLRRYAIFVLTGT